MQSIVSLFAVAGALIMTAFGVRVERDDYVPNSNTHSLQEALAPENNPLATTLAESVEAEKVFAKVPKTTPLKPSAPSPQPTAVPTVETDNASSSRATISFIDFPTKIQSGKSFTLAWTIDGPLGATVTQASLETSYVLNKSTENNTNSVSNNSTQGYGSFTLPKTLSSTHTYSGAGATVEVTARAQVNGQAVIERKTLTVK